MMIMISFHIFSVSLSLTSFPSSFILLFEREREREDEQKQEQHDWWYGVAEEDSEHNNTQSK